MRLMMRRIWSSLSLRLIVAASIWLAFVLGSTAWVLSSVYREAVTRTFDERLAALSRILISTLEIDRDGKLYLRREIGEPLFETAYSGWYWQIGPWADDPKAPSLLRSRSLFDENLIEPRSWSEGRAFALGPNGEVLRLLRARVILPRSARPFEILVAGNYSEVTAQTANYTRTLALTMSLIAGGSVIAVILQVHFALRPMRRVRRSLSAIREGRANRLEGSFPREVEPLIRELNALLAHNEQVLTRARTEVGNLAHALKTPLSVLRNEASDEPSHLAETVRRESETMRRQVDHHLARARAAASANVLSARTPVAPRAEALVRAMTKIHRNRHIAFALDCPQTLVFRGEAQDLDEILGNLLDNAGKWAKSRVTLTAQQASTGRLRIAIEDDGPGLIEDEIRALRARGARLDESVPGTGLGLSIVKDMVGVYGGDLALLRSSLGGLRAELTLPSAE